MIIRCKHINYSMRRDDTYSQRLQERKKKAAATATKPHQKTQSGIPSIVGHNAGGIIVELNYLKLNCKKMRESRPQPPVKD